MYTQLNNSTGTVVGTVPVTFILGSKGT